MSGSHGKEGQPTHEASPPIAERDRREEPMDDEEKILAGRDDANMPALLTRDVPGG